MSTIAIWLVAVGFAGMGVAALVLPERIPAMFGGTARTVDSRNEVRAVYGGFGIAVAGVLIAAPEDMRAGVLLAVAVALFGMAGGRVVGFALERPSTFYPTVAFAVIESVLGAVLLWAS
jgi:hypothetical protein